MEELIAKIQEQYSSEDYAGMLDSVTEINAFVETLNNAIDILNEEKENLNSEIAKITEENQKLKNANASLFLKCNGSEASDPKPSTTSSDDYIDMINPDDFKF